MVNEFLALDVGHVRTGIARGSDGARLAAPLETVATEKALERLAQLVRDLDAAGVVVGLPRNLRGEDTAQTAWVRQWVDEAKKELKLPFYWQDEALSSKQAQAHKLAGKGLHDIDALAAAIIMQDFLDTPEAERVVC